MGNRHVKNSSGAQENQRAESSGSPEMHGTQPAREASSDTGQTTAKVHCAEVGGTKSTSEENEADILTPDEGMEGEGLYKDAQESGETLPFEEAPELAEVASGILEETPTAPERDDPTGETVRKAGSPFKCERCMLRDAFGDSLESSDSVPENALYFSSSSEPWIPMELSQIMIPPLERSEPCSAI